MNLEQLRLLFYNKFGLSPWPKQYEVDAATYGQVVNEIIQRKKSCCDVTLSIGPNGGVLYKNVELIISQGDNK